MNSYEKMSGIGVPDYQIELLKAHHKNAQKFVFNEASFDAALEWFDGSISACMHDAEAGVLKNVVLQNFHPAPTEYVESGYDSCQSHRQVSKVASEAVLIGGLAYEYELLGLPSDLKFVAESCQSDLQINENDMPVLAKIAKIHGAKQDFLFPGVTATDVSTESVPEMTYKALAGMPVTSVRTLTGVGGLRSDKDWNHVTDLPSFADLKVTEDKRYYPGLGIFFALKKLALDDIPFMASAKTHNLELYTVFEELQGMIKATPVVDFQGVTILCSAAVPLWSTAKKFMQEGFVESLDLESDFHSPSYELVGLRALIEGNLSESTVAKVKTGLKKSLGKLWSFNSTIHLPWTSELAPLSNDLIGRVTNKLGDSAIRYGVGYEGKSLEVISYSFGPARKTHNPDIALSAMALRTYNENDNFSGSVETEIFKPGHPLWSKVKEKGFLWAALEELS